MTLRVLAVDDSFTMRELLRHVLTGAGFEVDLAEDGVHAVEKLPDVIMTDLNMPRMDSFGLIAAVRKGPHANPRADPGAHHRKRGALEQRARAAGATGWIVKPLNEDSLIAAIRRVAAW